MKKYKNIIIAAVLCLLPMVYGTIIYNKLPEMLPSNFDFSGNIDAYTNKFNIIYIMPLILAGITILIYFMTRLDPRKVNSNNKLLMVSIFTMPLISNLIIIITILVALEYSLNVSKIMTLILSIMFIILGNYMPKAHKNYTIGIRLPWTLDDEENWNKTHKFGGICFIILGILGIISMFFNIGAYIIFIVMILINIIIMAYSYYIYYNKNIKK
ncbi:SdpI family protein [Oceanivirga salmonicida]|uniref:SdpI family protein n=1 Tax=Oceanivirga salmonicida TaxID=1769291 RepID=UPI000834CC47|nr:SdpI family protein [Oceanivirga salmonicida]